MVSMKNKSFLIIEEEGKKLSKKLYNLVSPKEKKMKKDTKKTKQSKTKQKGFRIDMGTQKLREEKGAHNIPLVFPFHVPLIA